VKRATALVFGAALAVAIAIPACGTSAEAPSALEEPLRVGYLIGSTPYPAQFFPGAMPAPGGGPGVAGVDVGPAQAAPGKQGKGGYIVRLDKRAFSVAVRLAGRANGYWVARVDQPEALFENQVSASLTLDVSPEMSAGNYQIELSGIDVDQRFGDRSTAPLVVVPRPGLDAPVVISLRWDAAVDLDLQVQAPDGTVLSPKRPTTAAPTTADAGAAPGVGRLDRDSMASCVEDGAREENVIFTTPPSPGPYRLFVNAFSMCRRAGTSYELTVRRNGALSERFLGRVSEAEARQGGYGVGDFVAEITF
jgi:hypothetical protein